MLGPIIPAAPSTASAVAAPVLLTSLSVTTSSTPATYTTFPSQACNMLVIENQYNLALEYQRDGAGTGMIIAPRQTRIIVGISNANQIGIRRQDQATARSTQTVAITANCYNRTDTSTFAGIHSFTKNGAGFSQLATRACTAVDILNTSGKRYFVCKGSSTGPIIATLLPKESVTITGVVNQNELWVGAFDQSGGAGVIVSECFTSLSNSGRSSLGFYAHHEVISDNARVYVPDMQASAGNFDSDKHAFATLPMFSPFRRHKKPKSQMLTMFRDVASTLSPTTGLTDSQVVLPDVGWNSIDATVNVSRLRYTFTTTGQVSFTSSINAARPINTQSGLKGAIHLQAKHTSATRYARSITIDLFSAATPTAPDANNYHSLSFDPTIWNSGIGTGIHGAYGFHISKFTAVGSGADLTAITYARVRVTGGAGEYIELGDISFVPNVDTKAKIIFTFDDGYVSPVTVGLPILSRYGYPGVLFPSPIAKNAGGYQSIPSDMMLQLQNNYGWQIAAQDYHDDTLRDMTALEYVERQSKVFAVGAMLGFDTDGLRDGSWYGGGTYPITLDQMRMMPRLFATACTFYNGSGNSNDTYVPFETATTYPLADPYRLPRLNFSSFSNTDPAAMANKHKLHVDQAIAVSGVAIFAMHSDLGSPNTASAFSQLIEYIRDKELAGQCEVVTLRDLRKTY